MNATAQVKKRQTTERFASCVRLRLKNLRFDVVTPDNDPKGLIPEFLSLRKRIFVDNMGWDVPHEEGREAEQYDHKFSTYIIANGSRHSGVVGGARLLNTGRPNPINEYSYMIRDAYLRRLPGLPHTICSEAPPVRNDIWEMSRLAALGNLELGSKILAAADLWLSSQGAEKCLFLGSPAFMRMAKKRGYAVTSLGPVQKNEDGRFIAFSTDILSDALQRRSLQ